VSFSHDYVEKGFDCSCFWYDYLDFNSSNNWSMDLPSANAATELSIVGSLNFKSNLVTASVLDNWNFLANRLNCSCNSFLNSGELSHKSPPAALKK
jgi:hypothetical protein